MKALCALLICVLVSAHGYSINYYISNSNNTTSNTTSPSATWSLAKLNSTWSIINGGDSVLFHKGETFNGTITIGKSGTSTSPIIVASYGTASSKPLINGLVTLTSSSLLRTATGGNVYRFPVTPIALQLVMVNGNAVCQGRFPDAGYITVTANSGTTTSATVTAAIANLPASPNWTGAQIATRSDRWRLDRFDITGQSSTTTTSTITYSNQKKTLVGSGFFIINDTRTLTKRTEWFYSAGNLDMYFPTGETPATNKIEVSVRNNLIYCNGYSNIEVRDIALKGSNGDAIYVTRGSNFTVDGCDISYSGEDGFRAGKTGTPTVPSESYNNIVINNCTIKKVLNGGIWSNVFTSGNYATITNNTIDSVCYIAGMGQGGQFDGYGIINWPPNSIIEKNTITNTGYTGICFFGANTTVRNNFISTFCFVKDDGAGIYTWGPSGDTFVTTLGRNIINNIIMHGIGAPVGTQTGLSVEGIYNDDWSNNVTTTGNTVFDAGRGMYIHNSEKWVIRNNTFFNSRSSQMQFRHDNIGGPITKGKSTKNILFSSAPTYKVLVGQSDATALVSDMGILDSNWYTRPINDSISTTTLQWRQNTSTDNTNTDHNVSLAGWQLKYPNYDKQTKKAPKYITTEADVRFEYNATLNPITVNLNGNTYVDATGVTYNTGSLTLDPFTSRVLLKTGLVPVGPPVVSVTAPANGQQYSAPAIINIAATASSPSGSITKVDFYNGSTLLFSDATSPYSYSWTNVAAGNYTITAKATNSANISTTSSQINVVVNASNGPTVIITSPANNAQFIAPATIVITATATVAP